MAFYVRVFAVSRGLFDDLFGRFCDACTMLCLAVGGCSMIGCSIVPSDVHHSFDILLNLEV